MSSQVKETSSSVKVLCRFRPLNSSELRNQSKSIVNFYGHEQNSVSIQVSVREIKHKNVNLLQKKAKKTLISLSMKSILRNDFVLAFESSTILFINIGVNIFFIISG